MTGSLRVTQREAYDHTDAYRALAEQNEIIYRTLRVFKRGFLPGGVRKDKTQRKLHAVKQESASPPRKRIPMISQQEKVTRRPTPSDIEKRIVAVETASSIGINTSIGKLSVQTRGTASRRRLVPLALASIDMSANPNAEEPLLPLNLPRFGSQQEMHRNRV